LEGWPQEFPGPPIDGNPGFGRIITQFLRVQPKERFGLAFFPKGIKTKGKRVFNLDLEEFLLQLGILSSTWHRRCPLFVLGSSGLGLTLFFPPFLKVGPALASSPMVWRFSLTGRRVLVSLSMGSGCGPLVFQRKGAFPWKKGTLGLKIAPLRWELFPRGGILLGMPLLVVSVVVFPGFCNFAGDLFKGDRRSPTCVRDITRAGEISGGGTQSGLIRGVFGSPKEESKGGV